MAAVREQVLSALFTLLDNLRGLSPTVVLNVERDRPEPVTRDLCPILVMHSAAPATIAEETDDHVRHTMRVVVEGYVTASTDAALMAAATELYGYAKSAVYANRTLGGVAFDIAEQESDAAIDREQGHAPMGHFAMTLRVDYQTAPNNPFVAP